MPLPPGPRQPALAQSLEWVMRPAQFMERCRNRYGDCFTVRLGLGGGLAQPIVFLTDPAAVKALYSAGPEVAPVGEGRQNLAPMFGQRSVLIVDGADHLRQRRLMLPPFHGPRMATYEELIAGITKREADTWPKNKPFALQPRMQAITLEVILRAVFGLDDSGRRAEVRRRIEELLRIVANPLGELLIGFPRKIGPLNLRSQFERRLAQADSVLIAEIERRRADPRLGERQDVLSLLLQARDENDEAMASAELRDQLVTLLLAGHETTATALAWTFDCLFQHAEVFDRLVAECAQRNCDSRYMDAVLSEVLRLRPPIAMADRTLAAPLELGGYSLPAGTVVAPCIFLLHRRADLYPDPEAFQPQRFLERSPETYAWIPFGGGVRRCLGASFATFEMKVVLRSVMSRVRLRAASRRPERIRKRAIVLAPRHGTRAVVAERLYT
jgi:cytochrome P450 family 135